jgi:hypothetical protein
VIEFSVAATSGRAENISHNPIDVSRQAARTLGVFVLPWTWGEERRWGIVALLGVVLTVVVIALIAQALPPARTPAMLLAGAVVVYTVISALPAPLLSDPRDAGPRYYFLPFVSLSFLLIHLAAVIDLRRSASGGLCVLMVSALLGVLPVLHRRTGSVRPT